MTVSSALFPTTIDNPALLLILCFVKLAPLRASVFGILWLVCSLIWIRQSGLPQQPSSSSTISSSLASRKHGRICKLCVHLRRTVTSCWQPEFLGRLLGGYLCRYVWITFVILVSALGSRWPTVLVSLALQLLLSWRRNPSLRIAPPREGVLRAQLKRRERSRPQGPGPLLV